MLSRRVVTAVAFCLVMSTCAVSLAAAQVGSETDVSGLLSDDQDEAVIIGQEEGGSQTAKARDASIVAQVVWLPTCDLNTPARPTSAMCTAAATSCPLSEQPAIQMSRWSRLWNSNTNREVTTWEITDVQCVGASSPVKNVHALVLREFQDRVKLMKAPLHIQPPNGRTLVNFDTIFWTADPTRTFVDIPILGHSVDLRILPTQYLWRFGDGLQSQTATPGGPYPNKDVAHRYAGIGGVHPSLAVTYRGQYRVDGGPWIDMVGTATVDGPEVELTVVETRAQLVGG